MNLRCFTDHEKSNGDNIIIFLGICAVGVLVAGPVLNNPLLCSAAFLSFAVFYAWTNNAMMSYAERNVYDHTDQTS